MSIAFFGQGMTNLGWTVVSDVAPKKLIGLTSGIFNFSANLAGIVTPLVIGIAFQMTGSFVGPLVYIGGRRARRRLLVQRDPRRHPPAGGPDGGVVAGFHPTTPPNLPRARDVLFPR